MASCLSSLCWNGLPPRLLLFTLVHCNHGGNSCPSVLSSVTSAFALRSVFLLLAGEPQPPEPVYISDQNLCYTEIFIFRKTGITITTESPAPKHNLKSVVSGS